MGIKDRGEIMKLLYAEDEPVLSEAVVDYLRFLYKGIIINHNKTEPTYTKTSTFFCGLVLERSGADFKLKTKGGVIFAGRAGRSGLFSFHQKGG